MYKQILHTPEGVRDIYNEECRRKLRIQSDLHQVLASYGYEDIQTPTFEFFDVFSREVGTVPSKELYKFFDREGNTLVLRPDMTPAIARAVAKYFDEEDLPVRLCYMSNTFINHSDFQGRLKETTQLGAELIGDGSVEADAEMIALVVESLLKTGLTEFQVSIGHVDFFKSLLRESKLDEEMEAELREFISNKNIFGVRELLEPLPIKSVLKEAFAQIPNLFGSVEILEQADACAITEDAKRALERLRKIYELMTYYGYEKYITFDLGVVSKYKYYTGIIFQAYTYGTGEPVAKGGRYDTLMDHFGKSAPAIGFAFVIDRLMSAMARQKVEPKIHAEKALVIYRTSQSEKAIRTVMQLRKEGILAELMLERIGRNYEAYAKKNGISRIIYMEG
jgi:ATP phosphoribosyltransferase regulatory subunit